jgi:hypothetical protein
VGVGWSVWGLGTGGVGCEDKGVAKGAREGGEMGVAVGEDVGRRERDIELFGAAAGGGVDRLPELAVPVAAEAICGLGEEEDEERPDLFGGVAEVVLGELGEGGLGRGEEAEEVRAQEAELRGETREGVGARRRRENSRAAQHAVSAVAPAFPVGCHHLT